VYRDAVPEVRVRASGSPDSGCAFEIVGLRLSHGSGDEIAVDWRVRTDSICQSASVPEVLAMRGGINERGVEHRVGSWPSSSVVVRPRITSSWLVLTATFGSWE